MDARVLKVEIDHPQKRTKRGMIPFTVRGFDFMDGLLVGAWVNPVTGVLQPIPNSELADFQTLNTGQFEKLNLTTTTQVDHNTPAGTWGMMAVDHTDQAIKWKGENTAGIGVKTIAEYAENTGWTAFVYSYGNGTDQNGVLLNMGWSDTLSGTTGVSIRTYEDGRVEVWKDDVLAGKGSISGGGGYQPGSVRGASYERSTNEYTMIRVEVTMGRFLTITSSKGGVFNFAAPWAIDQYNEDGEVETEAQPVLPESQFWWHIPKGGGAVIAAPVVYGYEDPYAVSAEFTFPEPPGTDAGLEIRPIPATDHVTVSIVAADGVSAYVPTNAKFRVKVAFTQTAFLNQITGYFPRIVASTPEETLDVTEWVLSCHMSAEDGPNGLSADLVIRGDAPIPLLTETEARPIRISLVAQEGEETEDIVILDGVGEYPDWSDGLRDVTRSVSLKVYDRLSLLRQARVPVSIPLDGLPLCRPVGDGESWVALILKEGGFSDDELDLPDLDFIIEDTPSVKGDANMTAEMGSTWGSQLEEAFRMAPQVIWGIRPTADRPEFYAINPSDSDPIYGVLSRAPDDVLDYPESELGPFVKLYDQHTRTLLPREGNVVRVTGYDPAANKGLQAYIADEDSADPESPLSEGKLGFPRQIIYSNPALTTQAMVNKLAQDIYQTLAVKSTLHNWTSFLLFNPETNVPVWRGHRVTLEGANPDGTDETLRVTSIQWSFVDESGQGLADESGSLPTMPVRLASYTGGAFVGLGGSSLSAIRSRRVRQARDGDLRQTGWWKIPATSPVAVVALSPP